MPLIFYRQNPDKLTFNIPAGQYDTTGASIMVVFKSPADINTINEEDANAILKKTVSIASNVTAIEVPLTKTDLTVPPSKYVCGAKLFLADGTQVPIELNDPSIIIKLSTVQDTTL